MNFNKHSELVGRHARLSPSIYHWVNYDEDKMIQAFFTQQAAAKGTRLHDLASILIREGVKLPDTTKTLNMYVNDCIGWKMTPELVLYYSENAFGSADALSFRQNILRISDLKTGVNEAKPTQLEVYAALFCLEYHIKPFELDGIELRIYQNDEIAEYIAEPVEIMLIIDKIISFNKLITKLKEEAEL